MSAASLSSPTSRLALHQGQALLMAANEYPSLEEMILEAVQNAIDAEAKKVSVRIDLRSMSISVTDDGCGVSRDKFEKALTSICQSIKERDKLGRFGRGMIAPLGKCDSFLFISCPRHVAQGFLEWTFKTDELLDMSSDLEIPCRQLTNYKYVKVQPKNRGGASKEVSWRTGVFIRKFASKRIVRKISVDNLAHQIVDRYAIPMRRQQTVVSLELIETDGTIENKLVRAGQWLGIPLGETMVSDQDAGEVSFRIFKLRRHEVGHRKGRVLVGEADNQFRMEFGRFAKQAGDWLSKEVVEALSSALFEGEILGAGINLQSNRREFEVNQSLVGFCAAIDGWWREIGSQHYKAARDEAKSERYESLTLRSLSVLEAMFKSDLGDRLRELVQTFKVGTVGKGHTELDEKKVIGCDVPGTSLQGRERPSGKKNSDQSDEPREQDEPVQEHDEHVPLVVQGPSGRPRRVVKNNSLGIKILHDEMPGYDRLWKFNETNGQLIFNIRHPHWESLENNDNALMRLMEHVLCQVLSLYSLDPEFRPAGEILLEVLDPYLVFLLSEADRYANRGPGRRNKSS